MKKEINYGQEILVSRDEFEAWVETLKELADYHYTVNINSKLRIHLTTEQGVNVEIHLRKMTVNKRGIFYQLQGDEYNMVKFFAGVNENYHSTGKGARSREHHEHMKELFSFLFDIENYWLKVSAKTGKKEMSIDEKIEANKRLIFGDKVLA